MLLFQNKNTELYENHLVSTETITMVKQQLGTSGCSLKSPGTKRLGGSSPVTKEQCHWKVKSRFSDARRSSTFACVFREFSDLPICTWCGVGDQETVGAGSVVWVTGRLAFTGLCKGTPETPGEKKTNLLPRVAVDGWWLLEKDFQQGWVCGTLLSSVISKPRVCAASGIQ